MVWWSDQKPYTGLAEEKFCKGISTGEFKFQAVAKKGIAEMHCIRHMDFNSELHAMFVGIVTESSNGADKSASESFDPEKYK